MMIGIDSTPRDLAVLKAAASYPGRAVLRPASRVDGFLRSAAADGWMARAALSPWLTLESPAAWAWFKAALDLPAAWAFDAHLREMWADCGLFPGVARIVLGADGLVDGDALLTAPDDWPNAGTGLGGLPAVTLPRVTRAALLDPSRQEIDAVGYLLADGGFAWGDLSQNMAWIGRDPEDAIACGLPWRMYRRPLDWAQAALNFRDGYDPDEPFAQPGGGAVVDLDRFIWRYGERLAVDCGRDVDLAAQFERRRKALLRPSRPKLPDVLVRAATKTGSAA